MANAAGKGWREGSVEAAFAAAKAEHKPMLLYWGAVWCPPCNELKSQVFSQPRFTELVQPLIAVALDGDSPNAQAWGERLHVGSYPTVLLLSPEGKELMRLPTSVSMAEFETALTVGLAAGHGFDAAMERGLAGSASTDDWRLLANYNWEEAAAFDKHEDTLLSTQAKLAQNVPANLIRERGLLTSQFLATAAAASTSDDAKLGADLIKAAASYQAKGREQFAWLLGDPVALQAARFGVVYGAEIEYWLYPEETPVAKEADAQWLQATATLAKDAAASIDLRLWARCAALNLDRLRNKAGPVPEAIKREVVASVAAADAAATTVFVRHAVISSGAFLLQAAHEPAVARQLLDRELSRTDTPWFYQSSYAKLEKAEGHDAAALAWSKKARESVQGRASRLQWIGFDLTMIKSIKTLPVADQDQRLAEVARDYYQSAMTLPDAFQGRNRSTAGRVAKDLKDLMVRPVIREMVEHYAMVCSSPSGPKGCGEHFAVLTGNARRPT